jgi:ribosome-binding factor A
VGEEIRHVLAAIFSRGELRDPDVAGVSITVSEVRMSPDLRNATAFVVPLGGGDTAKIVKGLNRAAPYLRGEVARAMQLRVAPTVAFLADTSFDEASRIDSLLRLPEVQRDVRPPKAKSRRGRRA